MKLLHFGHVLGGALLVAGTSIGAGMLALPVVSSLGGFLPSIIIYIISWFLMTIAGLLFLEISITMNKNSNIISMADKYLGSPGKIFSWIVYLFLFYCLSVAYISGGGELLKNVAGDYLSEGSCSLIFAIFFGFFVYLGALAVDRLNILLMIGLVVNYLLFFVFGLKHIDVINLLTYDYKIAALSFPVIIISFGYQSIIPSLTYYMEKNYKKIRLAIFIGTTIALLVYIVWNYLIMGIIPSEGSFGLKAAFFKNEQAIRYLRYYTKIKIIYYLGQFFSFFAITTSFLGVSLGLFDFISDGLKIKKVKNKKLLIALISFLPSVTIAFINPNLFLISLSYAGGVGGALLLLLLPSLMVFSKRYVRKEKSAYTVFGGRPLLFVIFLFVVFLLYVEIFNEIKRIIT